MTDQQFQDAVLNQLSHLSTGQNRLESQMDRLDDRMDNLAGRLDQLEEITRKGFEEQTKLLADVFQAPISEGVELYVASKLQEHEQQFHSDAVAA